jgi:hypothetical protein
MTKQTRHSHSLSTLMLATLAFILLVLLILTPAAQAQANHGPSVAAQFGQPGDIPVRGDYDGDDRIDIAVYRPSTGVWYIQPSHHDCYALGGCPFVSVQWGQDGDVPVPGDYDGDGRTDIAVWRPSNGMWWILFAASVPGLEKD